MDYFDISDDIQDYLYKNSHLYTESKIDRIIDRVDNTLEKMSDWIDDKVSDIERNSNIYPDKKLQKFDELLEKFEKRFDSTFSDWSINYALDRQKALKIFQSEITEAKETYLKNYNFDLIDYLDAQSDKKKETKRRRYLKSLNENILNQLKESKEIKQAEFLKRFQKEALSDVKNCLKELAHTGCITTVRALSNKTSGPIVLKFVTQSNADKAERQFIENNGFLPYKQTTKKERLDRTVQWLSSFLNTGQTIEIVYMGGSRPGNARLIKPVSINEEYLFAIDTAENIQKTYRLDNIFSPEEYSLLKKPQKGNKKQSDDNLSKNVSQVVPFQKRENSKLEQALKYVSNLQFNSLKDIRKKLNSLIKKANCILGMKTRALGVFEKYDNGTPKNAPFLSIHYEELEEDYLDEVLNPVYKKAEKPWVVSGKNINTQTFKNPSDAAHFFAIQCMNELFK